MTPTQLETRIQELLDGVLQEEHWPELREELMNSEEARRLYCSHSRMQSLLRQRAKGIESLTSPTPVIPMADLILEGRKKSIRVAALAAAAVLVIALVTMRLILVPEAAPVLTFAEAPGTQFTLTHDSRAEVPEGMVLEKGSRLQVSQGTVELEFGSGVRSVIQAPADVTLHESDTLFMRQGVAWFHVPKGAVGFKVKTHDLNIVDLGTEFGVFARPDNHDEVHVFKGKIKVTAKRLRKESTTLATGEGRRIDPIGRLDAVPIRATAFLTSLPKSLPHLHWSFDGKDKEIYRVGGNHPSVSSTAARAVTIDHQNPFTSVAGKFGNALSSYGRGGHMTTDWLGIEGNAPRTIAYWIRLSPNQHYRHPVIGWGARIEGREDTTSFFSYIETIDHGTVVNLSVGAYELRGNTPIADGQWHHIAHVYAGRAKSNGDPEMYSYIDGNLEKTSHLVAPNAPRDSDGNILLNTQVNTNDSVPLKVFDHLWKTRRESYKIAPSIDELYVFHGALSSGQVKRLYLKNEVNP